MSRFQNQVVGLVGALLAYILFTYALYSVETGVEGTNIKTLADAYWYSVVTLTTVGYGDFYPVTPTGKILGLFFVLGSIGIIGFVISQLSAQIVIYVERRKLGLLGTNFENHIVLVGWDRFGRQVVEEIIPSGSKVAVVCNVKDEVELIRQTFPSEKVFVLFGDYDNAETFKKVNIKSAKNIFVNFPDDTEALIYILNLKKNYPSLNYVVSLNNPRLKETFLSAGVRYVVPKSEIASRLVASYTFEPDVAEMAEALMTSAISGEDYDLQEYRVTNSNPYLGKDYLDAFINLKVEHNVVLVAISKIENGKRVLIKNPGKETIVQKDDYLVIIANGSTKRKITRLFAIEEGRTMD